MSDALASGIDVPRLAVYPEVRHARESAVDRLGVTVAGEVVCRAAGLRVRRLSRIAGVAERHADEVRRLADPALRARFLELGRVLRREGRFPVETTGECFAIVREAGVRTLGMRHHDVQLVGAYAMLCGMIAEMETGEGKSLTATLTAATACVAGLPAHVVTVNDYLARRDAEEMAPLFGFLGLRSGLVVQDDDEATRRAGYRNHVTYCTNKVLAFDYLRDQIALERRGSPVELRLEHLRGRRGRAARLLLRGLHFAIVDEADSVLIDEARTPLLISQEVPAQFPPVELERALELARSLVAGRDFSILADERRAEILPRGDERLAEAAEKLGGRFRIPAWRRELILKAISADHLFQRDEHYLVREDAVQIVDEYTGRVMPDRFWSEALHQLIELKEGCSLSKSRDTLARISYQRFFRRYRVLSGMTGTVSEVARELWRVYRLRVARIPTHRPRQRVDLGESVVASMDAKWDRIAERSAELVAQGRAVLIGTRTVSASLEASRRLVARGLRHEVLNASQDAEEAQVIGRAGRVGAVTVATNMAGRGADIPVADEVNGRGGLHVILSERHEASRIDRQLQGRTGRQGVPGSHEAILSLEDPILGMDPSRWPRRLVHRLPETAPPWLRARLASWTLRRAQRRGERLHGRMRRQVVRADEQLDDMLAFSGKPE